MFKLLFKIIKKVVLGMLLLFAYNTFLSSFNVTIPINIISILMASVFDIPGIIGLVLFFNINY